MASKYGKLTDEDGNIFYPEPGFSLKNSDGNCKVLDNIYGFSMDTGNVGCICIKLGNTKFIEQGSMTMIKFSLYNYSRTN